MKRSKRKRRSTGLAPERGWSIHLAHGTIRSRPLPMLQLQPVIGTPAPGRFIQVAIIEIHRLPAFADHLEMNTVSGSFDLYPLQPPGVRFTPGERDLTDRDDRCRESRPAAPSGFGDS